jgi:hypothetical protein
VIVGLFAWGFAENWLRGGKAQAWAWVAAKFANSTTAAAAALPGGPLPTPTGQEPPAVQITQPAQ